MENVIERPCDYFCHGKFGGGKVICKCKMLGSVGIVEIPPNGVEFPYVGPDACLWLIRRGQMMVIAERVNGAFVPGGKRFVDWTPFDTGICFRPDALGLEIGDGFVSLPRGVPCIPSQNLGMIVLEEGSKFSGLPPEQVGIFTDGVPDSDPYRCWTRNHGGPC